VFVLAVSNLIHKKVRSLLSVLAVAIAITLLLVLVGLSHGTLNEVSQRMQSVEAEIVVRDRHFDLGSMSGGKLWEKEIPHLLDIKLDEQTKPSPADSSKTSTANISPPAIERVIPVFLGRMKLAGLSQNVFGVYPEDFPCFAGPRRLLEGVLFKDMDSPESAVKLFDTEAAQSDQSTDYIPLIIDQRLSRASGLHVGDSADFGVIPARIVGVVETGVAGRVFAPINMLRGANGISARTAHLFFIKAQKSLNTDQLQQLCEKIQQTTHRSAILVANYSQVLRDNFRNLTIFVNLVSVIALVICFLFIVVTIHTSVLERSREIAILHSLGASRSLILMQTIHESLIICSLGTLLGIVCAFGARWLIQTLQPLMTVQMRFSWLLIAAVIGLVGGILSALYPGYLALRHDPVETLSFE